MALVLHLSETKENKMLKESLLITGKVRVTLYGADGHIKESTTSNMVVTTGKQHVADQLVGQVQASMSHMAIGEDPTPPTLADTQLLNEGGGTRRKPFDSKDQGTGANANQVIYITTWNAGEGDGDIVEAGIFNAASSGVMLCRTTFTLKSKGAGDTLVLTWTLTVN